MKKIPLFIVFSLFIVSTAVGYAQQDIVCKGIITDSTTNLPLEDVRIYKIFNSDTIMYQTNASGEFKIPLQAGSKLFLKKKGYAWQNVRISNNEIQQIQMKPSKQSSPSPIIITREDTGKTYGNDSIDVYFNGHLVPASELNDALSIDVNEIITFSLRTTDERGVMYFQIK